MSLAGIYSYTGPPSRLSSIAICWIALRPSLSSFILLVYPLLPGYNMPPRRLSSGG